MVQSSASATHITRPSHGNCMNMHTTLIFCSAKKVDPSEVVVSEDRQVEQSTGALTETQQTKA